MSDTKAAVLVVDDTPENIMLVNRLLRARYKVKAAMNGEKALVLSR